MERANLDFANLPFAYQKTDANIRYWFRDGKWSAGELTADEHIPSTSPRRASTTVRRSSRVSRSTSAQMVASRPFARSRTPDDPNAPPGNSSCSPSRRSCFARRCTGSFRANRRFVPPYGSGASLYVRPLLLGVSAEVGVKPSHDYLFLVLVTPVGPYYKGGLTPVRLIVEEQIDRAAPGGVGTPSAAATTRRACGRPYR